MKKTRESMAAYDVLAERQRQIDSEGWSAEHDDDHTGQELAEAARHYADFDYARTPEGFLFPPGIPPFNWPWSFMWWKPKTYRENLVRAGALIIAEIERLDRMEKQP